MFEWIFILLWCSHYSMSFLSERWFSNFSRKTVTNQLVINSSVWVCVFVLSLRICPPELRISPEMAYLSRACISVLSWRICLELAYLSWVGVSVLSLRICPPELCICPQFVLCIYPELGYLSWIGGSVWDGMAAFSDYLRWDGCIQWLQYLRWDGCIQWLFEMGWLHSVTIWDGIATYIWLAIWVNGCMYSSWVTPVLCH